MATEFTVSVASSGGDFTTLNAAIAGVVNTVDLTAADIKVFSLSGATATPPAAGDSLLGLTSAATAVCVLVNAAKTQALFKTISGTFQSGETVKKVTDVTKEVTLSDAGAAPIVGLKCANFLDTTKATVAGGTTNATNYVRIYAADNHNGLYGTSSYRLETTDSSSTGSLYINQAFTRLEGLLVANTTDDNGADGIAAAFDKVARIDRCIVKNTQNAATFGNSCYGIQSVGGDRTADLYVANCIVIWKWGRTGSNNTSAFFSDSSGSNKMYCYNCTAIGDAFSKGFFGGSLGSGAMIVKNGLASGFAAGFSGNFSSGTDYNASSDTTASVGAHSRISQTFTFVNAGAGNYQLAGSDTGAKGFGVDLSADATYPISVDVTNTARSGTWDIGAWIAAAASTLPTPLVADRWARAAA